jgi:hypothetical protein
MTDKEHFDALVTIFDSCWNSFDKRRAHVWRFCLSFWIVIISFAALLLRGEATGSLLPLFAAVTGAVILLAVFLFFITGASGADQLDKDMAFFAMDNMRDIVRLEWPDEIEVRRSRRKNRWAPVANWSAITQCVITALLLLALVLLVYEINSSADTVTTSDNAKLTANPASHE